MIKINDIVLERKHFPDGTQMLLNIDKDRYRLYGNNITIEWKYESDEEYLTLRFIKRHFDEHYPEASINLNMLYCPNARMDRTKSDNEVFTLKYFTEAINDLKFKSVTILDPHSNVSTALIEKVYVTDISNYLRKILSMPFCQDTRFMLYFPDAGSLKRYGEYKILKPIKKIYGVKDRDWATGEIKGLKIFDENDERIDYVSNNILKDTTILMIDDIISYGGTLYHSAKKLAELGCKNIYAYATHTENSILDGEKGTFLKALNDGTVKKLFTTDSLFSATYGLIENLDI